MRARSQVVECLNNMSVLCPVIALSDCLLSLVTIVDSCFVDSFPCDFFYHS